jgi:hypothetical protein
MGFLESSSWAVIPPHLEETIQAVVDVWKRSLSQDADDNSRNRNRIVTILFDKFPELSSSTLQSLETCLFIETAFSDGKLSRVTFDLISKLLSNQAEGYLTIDESLIEKIEAIALLSPSLFLDPDHTFSFRIGISLIKKEKISPELLIPILKHHIASNRSTPWSLILFLKEFPQSYVQEIQKEFANSDWIKRVPAFNAVFGKSLKIDSEQNLRSNPYGDPNNNFLKNSSGRPLFAPLLYAMSICDPTILSWLLHRYQEVRPWTDQTPFIQDRVTDWDILLGDSIIFKCRVATELILEVAPKDSFDLIRHVRTVFHQNAQKHLKYFLNLDLSAEQRTQILVAAAQFGSLNKFKLAYTSLKEDLPLDQLGNTLLHRLCQISVQRPNQDFNEVEVNKIIDFLLEEGWKVDARNKNGETPLLAAISKDYFLAYKILSHLIEKGADVSATDLQKNHALHRLATLFSRPVHRWEYKNIVPFGQLLSQKGIDREARNQLGQRYHEVLEISSDHFSRFHQVIQDLAGLRKTGESEK